MNRIRRTLTCLAAAATTTTALAFGTASPAAAAFGDESLQCTMAWINQYGESCYNDRGASTYGFNFALFGAQPGYTYTWSISGQLKSVAGGCTSTSSSCYVLVGPASQDIIATVTYSDGVHTGTRSAVASVEPYCGGVPC